MIFYIKYECDVRKNQNEYNWSRLYDKSGFMKMPQGVIKAAIPAFGDDIIFFFAKGPCVYCLDLVFNEWVGYQDKELEFSIDSYFNLCLAGDYVYCIETCFGHHFKIKLSDILPKKLKQKHVKRNELIMLGYIRSVKDALSAEIPSDLVRLLLAFTSVFSC